MTHLLFAAIVFFVIVEFAIDQTLSFLNQKAAYGPLPKEALGIYSDEKRQESQRYLTAKYKLGLFSATVSTLLMLAALYFQWFAWLDSFVRDRTSNSFLISLSFIAIASVASSLASLPFGIYGTFVLEERFGFNKTTLKLFIIDLIKGAALGAVIGGAILSVILWLYETLAGTFWIAAWAVVAIFSIIMFMFGTSVILPLFNKVKPLEAGPLRTEIEKYCASQGYSLRRLFVMDASKRSTKANAFFSGLGKSKTIVLFDTLIAKLDTKETVAVLAHEVGHYKLKHTLRMFISSNIQSFAIFFLLGQLLGNEKLSQALGVATPSFHISALAFFLLLTPINTILGLINNSLTRRDEHSADIYAAKTYSGTAIKSGLKKISTDSLSNLSPHPLYVAFNYSHPPLTQRMNHVDAFAKGSQ